MPAIEDHAPLRKQNEIHNDPRNARYGAALFLIYLLMYAGFVAINAFDRAAMDTVVVAGINFALLYGFGLILSAIVLTLVYSRLSRAPATAGSRKKPTYPRR
jgi:uncharacterized membrane protein (DUF485 family)